MPGTRVTPEDVYGRSHPQGPRARAKAELPQPQMPASNPTPLRPRLSAGPPPDDANEPSETRTEEAGRGHPPRGGHRPVRPGKASNGAPTARSNVSHPGNAGLPTGREPDGNGVPVVVVGVTPHHGGRESRPQGEGGQVTAIPRHGEVREMRSAATVLGIIRDRAREPTVTGEPDAVKVARPVRRGADGKVPCRLRATRRRPTLPGGALSRQRRPAEGHDARRALDRLRGLADRSLPRGQSARQHLRGLVRPRPVAALPR